jgi:hypothetical protein
MGFRSELRLWPEKPAPQTNMGFSLAESVNQMPPQVESPKDTAPPNLFKQEQAAVKSEPSVDSKQPEPVFEIPVLPPQPDQQF